MPLLSQISGIIPLINWGGFVIMNKKFTAVDAGLFCEGMYIRKGIYYLYNGSFTLLCKDITLTNEMVTKLTYIAAALNGIYIETDSYEELWNESLYLHRPEIAKRRAAFKQAKQSYDSILSNTFGLLGEAPYKNSNFAKTSQEISESIAKQIKSTDATQVLQLVNMIQETDNYLYAHSVNVASLNGMIGQWMGLSPSEVEKLVETGLLHDIGKLNVPPEILNKPGRLTEEEFEQIKLHPIYSYNILQKSGNVPKDVLMGIRGHHERSDCSGYPDKLGIGEILPYSKITAVSDVYDAMVSKRCYKEANTPFKILAEFERNRFSQLDPQIVGIFLKNIPSILIGTQVLLSTHERGEVVFVSPHDYEYPFVRIGNQVIKTDSDNQCISIL